MFPTFNPVNTYSQGQVNNAQADYGSQEANALNANNALKQYQSTMQNPSDMYSQNLSSAENQLGANPQQIQQAANQLAVTQNQMAFLPQSVNQQGGGYGTTAGQIANNYNQTAGNLQSVLGAQGNNLNAAQANYQNALSQAGTQTGFGVQGQQMQLGALQNIYQNAYQQQQTSLQNMQYLESAYQSQGQWNEDEARQYAASYASYQQALAAANQANAQAKLFNQQAQEMPNEMSLISNYLKSQPSTQQAASQSFLSANGGNVNPNYTTPNVQPSYLGALGNISNAVGNYVGNGVLSLL